MELVDRIREMIEPTIQDMGYDLIRVLMIGSTAKNRRLQIMADRLDGAAITVDDCADISRAVSALLDVEDPIATAYALEVSSPGIDRPLVKLADFERFKGHQAKVEMQVMIEGQKRFSGEIVGTTDDGQFILELDGDVEAHLNIADLSKAKLVLTDALIDFVTKQQKAASTDSGAPVELDAADDADAIEGSED